MPLLEIMVNKKPLYITFFLNPFKIQIISISLNHRSWPIVDWWKYLWRIGAHIYTGSTHSKQGQKVVQKNVS